MKPILPQENRSQTASAEDAVAVDYWDDDTIQAVIRAASQRGVCPTTLLSDPGAFQQYGSYTPTVRLG